MSPRSRVIAVTAVAAAATAALVVGVAAVQTDSPEGVATASGIFLGAMPVSSAIGGTIGGIGVAVIGLPQVFFVPALLTTLATAALVMFTTRLGNP